jgi:hypothetical protein
MRKFLSKIKQKIMARVRPAPASAPAPEPEPEPAPAGSAPEDSANVVSTAAKDVPTTAKDDVATSTAEPSKFAAGMAAFGTQAKATATAPTLTLTLKNQTNSSTVYAYVTGQAINQGNALFLLRADGRTPYLPASPSATSTPLGANCAIPLGAPGNSVNATIPYIAGGRVWFSIGAPLTFLLNPGPGLVEPSVTNPADPNYDISWAFAEFTYNSAQMYANISFVDFVSLPISLSLTNTSGATSTVPGLPHGGLTSVCNQLRAQTAADGVAGWTNLIVSYKTSGTPLRALSANNGLVLRPTDFAGYFEPYVAEVFAAYASKPVSVQINSGVFSGKTASGSLVLGSEAFARPSTADILSCNSGPFTTGADTLRNTLIPQLAAAFNRSTLLETAQMPSALATFYQNKVTNHYARIVHGAVTGGKGYAFPYDDVPPSSGGDQSGFVSDPNPVNMTLAVGYL